MPNFQSTCYPDRKKPVTLLKCDLESVKEPLSDKPSIGSLYKSINDMCSEIERHYRKDRE